MSTSTTPTTVVVALSGGVDSAVAAALLQQRIRHRRGSTTGQERIGEECQLQAIHMSNWNDLSHDDDSVAPCSAETDWKDAQAVAEHLSPLPLTRLRFEAEYWNAVFDPFLQEFLSASSPIRVNQDDDEFDRVSGGKTGNPDVECNTHIKFGVLPREIQRRFGSSTWLATGHYARLWYRSRSQHRDGFFPPDLLSSHDLPRDFGATKSMDDIVDEALQIDCDRSSLILPNEGIVTPAADWMLPQVSLTDLDHELSAPVWLLAARDLTKDQSYFLSGCSAQSLSQVMFPIGDLHKMEHKDNNRDCQQKSVRQMAQEFQLPVATKRESMGICFIGQRKHGFAEFCQEYLPAPSRPVRFIDVDTGELLGVSDRPAHALLYTTGQGARIGGSSTKYFVVNRDAERATVYVCAGTHHPALYADMFWVQDMNWIVPGPSGPLPLQRGGSLRVKCRIRHLQPLVDCTVTSHGDHGLTVTSDSPLRAITPGQRAVFYALDGLVCLGGGVIRRSGPSYSEMGKGVSTVRLHPSGHNDKSLLGS